MLVLTKTRESSGKNLRTIHIYTHIFIYLFLKSTASRLISTNQPFVDCITDVCMGLFGRGLKHFLLHTSTSDPFIISINCRHLSINKRFWSRSKSPGYNRLVLSMASPILPARTNFSISATKHCGCNAILLQQHHLLCLFFIDVKSSLMGCSMILEKASAVLQ